MNKKYHDFYNGVVTLINQSGLEFGAAYFILKDICNLVETEYRNMVETEYRNMVETESRQEMQNQYEDVPAETEKSKDVQ